VFAGKNCGGVSSTALVLADTAVLGHATKRVISLPGMVRVVKYGLLGDCRVLWDWPRKCPRDWAAGDMALAGRKRADGRFRLKAGTSCYATEKRARRPRAFETLVTPSATALEAANRLLRPVVHVGRVGHRGVRWRSSFSARLGLCAAQEDPSRVRAPTCVTLGNEDRPAPISTAIAQWQDSSGGFDGQDKKGPSTANLRFILPAVLATLFVTGRDVPPDAVRRLLF